MLWCRVGLGSNKETEPTRNSVRDSDRDAHKFVMSKCLASPQLYWASELKSHVSLQVLPQAKFNCTEKSAFLSSWPSTHWTWLPHIGNAWWTECLCIIHPGGGGVPSAQDMCLHPDVRGRKRKCLSFLYLLWELGLPLTRLLWEKIYCSVNWLVRPRIKSAQGKQANW